jgi:signal transduction histidine kinase
MQRLVEETLELLEGVIKTSGAEVNFDNSLPMVWADAPRIKTVWQNLIENAIKYAKRGENPEIRIGVSPHTNGYAFYVKDRGIGIDPRYHERVFEQFHKLDTSSDGSGIGLALVRRILEAHNGRVWIESEGPDLGTTAWFLLPRPPLGEPNGN